MEKVEKSSCIAYLSVLLCIVQLRLAACSVAIASTFRPRDCPNQLPRSFFFTRLKFIFAIAEIYAILRVPRYGKRRCDVFFAMYLLGLYKLKGWLVMTLHAKRIENKGELPDDLVTLNDIVSYGWCSRTTLERRIARGVVTAYRVGAYTRVSKSEVARVFEEIQDGAGISRIDPSEAAFDRVTKCINENLPMLDAEQRRLLAGHLTGNFGIVVDDGYGVVNEDCVEDKVGVSEKKDGSDFVRVNADGTLDFSKVPPELVGVLASDGRR